MSMNVFSRLNQSQPSQNPMSKFTPEQIQMAKNMLAGKGVSAEQMVRGICQQRGIDADQLIRQTRLVRFRQK